MITAPWSFSMTLSDTATSITLLGVHPVGHYVRNHRHLRRLPAAGLPQRRHHALLVRRTGHRFLPRNQSDSGRDGLRRPLGTGDRMGQRPGPYPGGFGHRHHLVGRYGYRRTVHEPAPGLHIGRPLEFPVRQHRNGHPHRCPGARRSDARGNCRHAPLAASGHVRRASTATSPAARESRPG